ncbi:hypothetical protein AAVH_05429 [Aphelenchoides avenae]|nr:hypothetical protein AAVH_05429 [Aphelenchus avenae]
MGTAVALRLIFQLATYSAPACATFVFLAVFCLSSVLCKKKKKASLESNYKSKHANPYSMHVGLDDGLRSVTARAPETQKASQDPKTAIPTENDASLQPMRLQPAPGPV